MNNVQHGYRGWIYCILSGFALMNVALFLHPMSPEDFLVLASTDPMATVLDANGRAMAICFWASFALSLVGVSGIVGNGVFFHRLFAVRKPGLKVAIH